MYNIESISQQTENLVHQLTFAIAPYNFLLISYNFNILRLHLHWNKIRYYLCNAILHTDVISMCICCSGLPPRKANHKQYGNQMNAYSTRISMQIDLNVNWPHLSNTNANAHLYCVLNFSQFINLCHRQQQPKTAFLYFILSRSPNNQYLSILIETSPVRPRPFQDLNPS